MKSMIGNLNKYLKRNVVDQTMIEDLFNLEKELALVSTSTCCKKEIKQILFLVVYKNQLFKNSFNSTRLRNVTRLMLIEQLSN